jgi:hypothetical protein
MPRGLETIFFFVYRTIYSLKLVSNQLEAAVAAVGEFAFALGKLANLQKGPI